MAWVAKEAGVSQGLAYHHFGSREGLLQAVVNEFYDRLEEQVLMAPLKEITAWEERECARTERYIAFLVTDDLGAVLMTRLSRTPAIAAIEAERWQRLINEGSRNMADGQRRGVIASKQDPALLAAMTLGAIRAAVTSAMQAGKSIQPKALTRETWQFLRAGLQLNEDS